MTLNTGDKAPDFTAKDENGNDVTLSSLRGRKVVLYFYPRDMTPGCTAEACSLRDNYNHLLKAGYHVFGISTDDQKSHQKFIRQEKLPFHLLSDVDKKVHDAYGTWVEKSMYGRKFMGTARVTFIIDEHGIIEEVIRKVDTENHADQILKREMPVKQSPVKKTPKKAAGKKTPVKKSAMESPKKAARKTASKASAKQRRKR